MSFADANMASRSIYRDNMTPINKVPEFVPLGAKSSEAVEQGCSDNVQMKSNMPSPPLSPYARSIDETEARLPELIFPRASKSIESELRNITSQNKTAVVSSPVPQVNTSLLIAKETIATQPSNSNAVVTNGFITAQIKNKQPNTFPLEDLKNSKLYVNPFEEFNKPGFKQTQLAFIASYHIKTYGSKQPSLNSSYGTSAFRRGNHNNRSAIRTPYETTKHRNYNSNSDYESTDLEKPRTRRFVRQNKVDLESEVESNPSSRPSTPKRRVPPTFKRLEYSPKRSRASTPVSYAYDYNQIEDFSPALDTLPNSNKCLKADWKGQSMDLSDDPLVSKLHPAEVVLAGTLRLPCAVYLDSKRRIFLEKVKRMRSGLPFRRTDAQKSCKIDVNKASRLFAAFEKVGWLNDSHFRKFT